MSTRRRFILGTLAAGAALVVGWGVMPPRQRLTGSRPLPTEPGQSAFNGWLKIAADGSIVVQTPKSEMGQGVHTALAMVLADELDADWARVRVEHPPLDAIYNNQATLVDGLPFHPDNTGMVKQFSRWLTAKSMREFGLQMTGGSSSLKDLWLPMREAGASARAMLVSAAAAQWGVKAEQCGVKAGVVSHPSGKSAGFGALAAAAAQQPLPRVVVLKKPEQFTFIGKPTPRIEAAHKGNGRAAYGLDVLLPGMLYATVKMCPMLGGTVDGFDAAAAQAMPGVKKVLQVAGHHGGTAGVAVIADSPWHALKALAEVKVRWNEAASAVAVTSPAALDQLAVVLDRDEGLAYFKQGSVDDAFRAAARTVKAEYRAPWLAHTALEPINCTVQVDEGRATVWAPTQVPGLARRAAALALGLPSEAVEVHVQFLGGGFGRRLDVDFVGQAAEIAKTMPGVPVQTFWSRAEDTQHDFYRPACVSRWEAAVDAQGRLAGVRSVSAGQAIVPAVLSRLFGVYGGPLDKTASEGAFDQAYEWPSARIAHANVELPVPVGFWRSVGHSHQAFFNESFVDECAAALGQDAVAFRLGLLKNHPRHAAVLKLAAEKAGWGAPLAPAADGAKKARGVALHQSFGTIVAQVVEASVAADKTIRVHRVVAAVDCGTPVNPNHIAQQMDSAVVYGLSAALYGEITLDKGRVQQSNFHDYGALRMDACPVIETHIVPSAEHPEGMGEPGTPPVAPALASALFALTGQRLRALPLKLA
ncbi:MAG: xanthine dehydrogenase family protein molybdopterin-binding subunit [Burkholderiales bacterium]|nr:xanthine dehydrogenase family protein molybdopterin-binding subunit [Burkholderiales bacterium]